MHWIPTAQKVPPRSNVRHRATLRDLRLLQLPLSHLEVLEHPQGLSNVLVLEPTLSHLESVLPRHLELLTLRQTLSYLESGQSKWLKLHCSAKASFQQGRSLELRA